jgi:hypothetical protein
MSFGSAHAPGAARVISNPPDLSSNMQGGEERYSTDIKKISQRLVPSDSHICYLDHVEGKFDGGGEQIYLDVVDGHWNLRVSAGCETPVPQDWWDPVAARVFACQTWKHVYARAVCYSYIQN